MTAADLAEYSSEWVEPISTTYRGWTVYEIPPNGQGIAALMMLNIMEKFPLAQIRTQFRRCAACDDRGEEARVRRHAPLRRRSESSAACRWQGMLAKDYAAERAKLIDMKKANCDVAPGQPAFPTMGDTTYLSGGRSRRQHGVADSEQLCGFGSRLVADGTGFALQNRGGLFSLDPPRRTRWRGTSGRFTPSFPRS